MRWWGLALSIVALAGCDASTQLLVIVDSDLGSELATVQVTASTEGALGSGRTFDVTETGLPFSFGVVSESDVEREVRIHVVGLMQDGTPILAHSVATRFLPGRTLRLEVPLARACVTEPSCEEMDLRCDYGDCIDPVVDPETLPEGNGAPTPLFDGPAPLPDAGVSVDGGCEADAPCTDETNPCRVGVTRCDGASPSCEITETLPEGADCGEGRTCDGTGQCGG